MRGTTFVRSRLGGATLDSERSYRMDSDATFSALSGPFTIHPSLRPRAPTLHPQRPLCN